MAYIKVQDRVFVGEQMLSEIDGLRFACAMMVGDVLVILQERTPQYQLLFTL
jgi:hypothetical protein